MQIDSVVNREDPISCEIAISLFSSGMSGGADKFVLQADVLRPACCLTQLLIG